MNLQFFMALKHVELYTGQSLADILRDAANIIELKYGSNKINEPTTISELPVITIEEEWTP